MIDALGDLISVGGRWAWLILAGTVVSAAAGFTALTMSFRRNVASPQLARRLQGLIAAAFAAAVVGVVGTWWVAGRMFVRAVLENAEDVSLAVQNASAAFSTRSYVAALASWLPLFALFLSVCSVSVLRVVRRDTARLDVLLTALGVGFGIFGTWAAIPGANKALSAVLRTFAAMAYTEPQNRGVVYVKGIEDVPGLLQSARSELSSTMIASAIVGGVLVALAGKRGVVASRRTSIGAALWLAFGIAMFVGTRGLARDVAATRGAVASGPAWTQFVSNLPPPKIGSCGTHTGTPSVAVVAGEALDAHTGLPDAALGSALAQRRQGNRLDVIVAAAGSESVTSVLRALGPVVPRDADVRLWAAGNATGTISLSLTGDREYVVHCIVPLDAPYAAKPLSTWQAWVDESTVAARPEPASVSELLLRAESEAASMVGTPEVLVVLKEQVRARLGNVQRCYEELLQRRPDLEGRVEIELRVPADGTRAEVNPAATNAAPASVTQCVLNHLAGIDTPPHGEEVVVALPFSFAPQR